MLLWEHYFNFLSSDLCWCAVWRRTLSLCPAPCQLYDDGSCHKDHSKAVWMVCMWWPLYLSVEACSVFHTEYKPEHAFQKDPFDSFSEDFPLIFSPSPALMWLTLSFLAQSLKESVISAMQYLTPASEMLSTLMLSRYNQHQWSWLAKCTQCTCTAWHMRLHYLALFCSILSVDIRITEYELTASWDRIMDVDYCKIQHLLT